MVCKYGDSLKYVNLFINVYYKVKFIKQAPFNTCSKINFVHVFSGF